jgi:hypothetical protein
MAKRRLFEAGDMVTTFTGQPGIVISEAVLAAAEGTLKEGKRPGHYFAPGCCHHPDYVVQVPVLFEDGTYDIMRAMNIRKATSLAEENQLRLQVLRNGLTVQQTAADTDGN